MSTNLKIVQNLTSASALALLVCLSPTPTTVELPSRSTANRDGWTPTIKATNRSENLRIVRSSYACNLEKTVHTPDSSARTAGGGIMQRALSTLASFKQLGDGWAGYESQKPNERSINDATAFASRILVASSMLEPIISPATDGEINFYWENQHITLDLGFYGDGSYSFYAKTIEGEELFGDNYSVETELPHVIFEHLQRA